ncbi:O-antigen translocase [Aeromonas caviae]|uniref:O-antigen translocase n=1 Tax=Aeromonas caviae TaxID=648 RepID=UPI000FEB88E3|nr:O-antigen translocase [Aeromonas caviae]RWT37562.1 O-antigen flippase [Aeromonas caviae]GKR01024.1 LPS biosynthesis protein [Aeromonas caviae]GKR23067.1 LPS biosynthesis protein [Aeromonas caviae]GKR28118.1 LPS biosynthesis protein [Aeromonas caviae]GKR32241.1 LPS biosynthesis protein [Aeromonas caviae]
MKRLLKVTAMTGLLTLLKMAMGFVIAKVVAVYTGPTGMAMLGQVQSMVASLNGIVNAPVGSGIVRYTAEKQGEGFEACAPWWRASLQWVLIISTITIPAGLLLADHIAAWLFQDKTLAWIVMVTVAVLPLSAIGTLCNSVINGQQLYRRYVGLGMLSALISGAVMLIMIVQANIKGALLATAVQAALIGVIMLAANLRQPWLKLRYWWGTTDKEARKAIGGYMLMAITSALTVPTSLILVRNILIDQVGWEAAGQWQAVWKISEVYLGVITMALGTYYLPRLSSLVGVDAIVSEIHKTARIVLPIVAILALGVYLLRDVAIWLLFTKEFNAARDLFAVQLCGDVIKIASWLYAYPMLSRGATKWFILTEVVFSLSFAALTLLFVSYAGIKGVTVAYLVNYFVYFLIIFLNVKKFAR